MVWSNLEKLIGCCIINSFNLTGANLNTSKQQQKTNNLALKITQQKLQNNDMLMDLEHEHE